MPDVATITTLRENAIRCAEFICFGRTARASSAMAAIERASVI